MPKIQAASIMENRLRAIKEKVERLEQEKQLAKHEVKNLQIKCQALENEAITLKRRNDNSSTDVVKRIRKGGDQAQSQMCRNLRREISRLRMQLNKATRISEERGSFASELIDELAELAVEKEGWEDRVEEVEDKNYQLKE